MGKLLNIVTQKLTSPGSIELPAGFEKATVLVDSTGSYTITNQYGQVSDLMSSKFTFDGKGNSYAKHVITWVSGTVIIASEELSDVSILPKKLELTFPTFQAFKDICSGNKIIEGFIEADETNQGNQSEYLYFNGKIFYMPVIQTNQ